MARRNEQCWLLKSEPSVFSFDDLMRAPGQTTAWDGVRNYKARNLLRAALAIGDLVLFYHSNAEPPGVAGVAEVASEPRPDPSQFDPKDDHFDPASSREAPRWWLVDVRARAALPRFVSLAELKGDPRLAAMAVCQRGNRLSVQPVTPAEWRVVAELGGLEL